MIVAVGVDAAENDRLEICTRIAGHILDEDSQSISEHIVPNLARYEFSFFSYGQFTLPPL